MKFVVNRQTWFRGQGGFSSKLLREDGMRCCVGFYAQACGIPDEQLFNVPTLIIWSDDGHSNENVNTGFLHHEDEYGAYVLESVGRIYDINDNILLTEAEREEQLAKTFAKLGITVKFED